MKYTFQFSLLLIVLVFSVTAKANANSGNGGDLVGNGGDGQVIEFRNTALEAAETLYQLNSTCQSLMPIKPLKLIQTIYRVKLESSNKELTLRNQRVEAINYPNENRIIFHVDSFYKNKNKKQFVLHELLGLLNINDQLNAKEYGVSKFLIELMNREECKNPVSKRKWVRKRTFGDTVYFQFDFPQEIIPYNLTNEEQLPSISFKGSDFSIWNQNIYQGLESSVCDLKDNCLNKLKTPWQLMNFNITGNKLIQSYTRTVELSEKSDPKNLLEYEGLVITDLDVQKSIPIRLDILPKQKKDSQIVENTLLNNIVSIGPNAAIGLLDTYYNLERSNRIALVKIEWDSSDRKLGNSFHRECREGLYDNFDGECYSLFDLNKKQINISQHFYNPYNWSKPKTLFSTQSGKFVIADSGIIFETSNSLNQVGWIEGPVEDVAEYNDYTIVLTAGRLVIYNEFFNVLGEFTPKTIPQAIAVHENKVNLFSMLSDQKLFVETHDVNDFYKKRRTCLISDSNLKNLKPKQKEIFQFNFESYFIAKDQGCIFKFSKQRGWERWMGIDKLANYYVKPKGNLVIAVTEKSKVFKLDIENRDEFQIANLDNWFYGIKDLTEDHFTIYMAAKQIDVENTNFNSYRFMQMTYDGVIIIDGSIPDPYHEL